MHERRIKGYYQGNRLRVPAWSLMQYQETRNRAWREDEKRLRVAHLSPKRIANVRKAQDVRRMIRENKKSIKESFLENNSQE